MKLSRRQLRADIPSVAMGDIAFNLLVFFVILARSQDDSHLKWQPAVTPKIEAVGQPRASVTIDREHKLFLNGQPVGESQLADSLQRILGDSPAGERKVFLKIHHEATALRFEPVIEAVSEAGGELVHVLQEQAPEKTPSGTNP